MGYIERALSELFPLKPIGTIPTATWLFPKKHCIDILIY